MPGPFDLAEIRRDARAVDALDDFGPGPFEEPLGVLLESYAAAPLSDLGTHILRGGVVRSLSMRLRATAWFRRHPEIADEEIAAPIVVVGMMRSGTTLMQRILAADPRVTCAYGWEIGEVAPSLDTDWAAADPRIAAARAQEAQSRKFVPELFAIHPMYAEEAEEEIMFLADAFLSHVPEASADVPAYRRWLDDQDFTPAYDHLHRMLQLLQWQKRRRGVLGDRWVLKTPAHLGYLDELAARFPDAHLVHLHRDPVDTIPSGASLNTTLWRMHSDTVDPSRVGTQWIERMGFTNDRAMASRDSWEPERGVTDLLFEDVVADPVHAVARVYDDIEVELTADAEGAMRSWVANRPRETAGRPAYTAADFGLSEDAIRDRFRDYTDRYRPI
ncbi:MAG: putative sulfotransferase [Acidimicrobiales bacterium]|nr:MAG: putative sulfotransferase [Acidimicrobiales bacterium]